MTDVTITPDTGCGMQVHGWKTTRWQSFIMFYMYPKTILPKPSNRELMSRLAVHQGIHIHPERKVFSRKSLEKVKGLLERHHSANPTPTPSRLKNGTIADVIAEFRKESAAGLNKDKEKEIWETLQIVSTLSKFMSLLQSVCKDSKHWKGNGIFYCLQKMQKNVHFLFIQQYRVPGQGSEKGFPFIFKMSSKGAGSGVDLLKRMRPGNDLFGTWVMFDVMHQITTGWLTFSAHIYDHNYRALCTIFTCKLLAKDADSCKIAWTKMIEIARESGVTNVHIHGFVADNAGADEMRSKMFSLVGSVTPREKEATLFTGLSPFKEILGTVSRTEDEMSMSQCGKSYKMHKI
jgi:hypothetical protein